jgi:hypothetical protein
VFLQDSSMEAGDFCDYVVNLLYVGQLKVNFNFIYSNVLFEKVLLMIDIIRSAVKNEYHRQEQ